METHNIHIYTRKSKRHYLRLVGCFFLLLTTVMPAKAGSGSADVNQPLKSKPSKPYCGLYCLYSAMKLSGKEINFNEFIKPEYFSSSKGSSLENLKKAAEDQGMYATPLGKLTSRELRTSVYPVILHVKATADSKNYDHFELFLGTENGQAKIFNFPEPTRLVPFYELAPRWDGTGLILSAEPIDLAGLFAPTRKRLMLYIVAAIAVILISHWTRQRWSLTKLVNSRTKLFSLSIAQAAGFAILALLSAMLYHFANDEGFLAHANATSSVQQTHVANFIPKVSSKKVAELLNSDTVIIDARHASDFGAGHIESAINIPVDVCDKAFSAALTAIDKNASIVVYCQSAGCPYAEKTTKRLKENGFSNISIFKGGWNEWNTKENNSEQKK